MNKDLHAKLVELRKIQDEYSPAQEIATQLSEKILVMMVGPSAIGKTTLMDHAVAARPDVAYVSGFTTRAKRPHDRDGLYQYLTSHQEIGSVLADISAGRVVQYMLHPVNDTIYGSIVGDFPKKYNLHDSLSGSVESMRKLPFEKTLTVSVTAEPEVWKRHFLRLNPEPSSDSRARLVEARQSIEWSLAQDDRTTWLINIEHEETAVTNQLIDLVTQETIPDYQDGAREHAKQMIQTIEELLS